MGLMQSYGLLLLKNPGKIILAGVSFVLILFGLTLCLRPFPNFKDPLVGFEVRGTTIANRLNTFKLLADETSASENNLSLQANSDIYEYVKDRFILSSSSDDLSSTTDDTAPGAGNKFDEVPIILEMSSTQLGKNSSSSTMFDDGEEEYYRSVNSSKELRIPLIHHSLGSSKAFCGKLNEGYAQVVVASSSKNANAGLFNLNSMIAICHLDRVLRLEQSTSIDDHQALFQDDCERFSNDPDTGSSCCNSFSLPNYVACLSNKTNCMDLKPHDMVHMEQLLNFCAPYYFRSPYEKCFQDKSSEKLEKVAHDLPSSLDILSASHRVGATRCTSVPEKCTRCNGWTYAVMHYLVSDNFIQNRTIHRAAKHRNQQPQQQQHQRKQQSSREYPAINKLSYTNIFLPIAKSTTLMKYYQAISSYNLKTPFAQVKAMDLGLKNSLFELLISQDARLFIFALVSILTVISIYTWSFLLSIAILMIICLSLCLSYSIYELVLNIPIFPFMNLLAVVISFGICSDNAMLFCKHWSQQESQLQTGQPNFNQQAVVASIQNKDSINSEQANMDRVLKRAVVSTLVATLATACSFIISAISGVVAVRCFCIYATLSVVTNYLLIVILLPPALIIDSRFSKLANELLTSKGPQLASLLGSLRNTREHMLAFGQSLHNVRIFNFVTRYKFYLIVTFLSVLACSSVLVFHRPQMRPADEDDIQLLSSRHAFEQYDKNLKKQFAFERQQLPISANNDYPQGESSFSVHDGASLPETLPIRVVFGVKPIDTGSQFDPQDRGRLEFDHKFDITEPSTQVWLLEFCDNLRKQKFVHQSAAERMSSCFMYTFKTWMKERSCRDPVLGDDLSPCCRAYEFPYSRSVFNRCIQEALEMFHSTPNYSRNPGVYFFKNSTKVAAIVVEYKSNRPFTESYTKMERFYSDIDEWVRLQINNTAPPGLRSGWFISSNLDLLALQEELAQSTSYSILLEVLFAMLALLIGTRDLVLTMVGSLTIGTIIISTIAALILFKWTLGVAESILISLTIGLSIDFALHYSVAFSERKRKASIEGIIHGILDEVGSPIGLATITTSLAGFVIVWSDILAYQELGVFLMLIALVNWISSTFFLLPMLATVSSILEFGQFYFQAVARTALSLVDQF